jgi:hypothetical protein
VRNFDQIKVGDTLTIKYLEAFAIELKKDGKAPLGRSEVKSMERSEPGKKPGGTATREITAVGEVVSVDTVKKHISVKNDKGQIIDLKIQDPEQLKLAKKGDQIQVTYTEAVAIEMTPAAPKAPAKAPEKAPAPEKKKSRPRRGPRKPFFSRPRVSRSRRPRRQALPFTVSGFPSTVAFTVKSRHGIALAS